MKNKTIIDKIIDNKTEVYWINPDTLDHVYCTIIGRITEFSSLVDFGDHQREVDNWELREID